MPKRRVSSTTCHDDTIWFKIIKEGGLIKEDTNKWAVESLEINGNAGYTYTISGCLADSCHLVRYNTIAIFVTSTYPGAQFLSRLPPAGRHRRWAHGRVVSRPSYTFLIESNNTTPCCLLDCCRKIECCINTSRNGRLNTKQKRRAELTSLMFVCWNTYSCYGILAPLLSIRKAVLVSLRSTDFSVIPKDQSTRQQCSGNQCL